MKWTKEEIIELFNELHKRSRCWHECECKESHLNDLSPEVTHEKADEILLQYINDEEITKAYEKIEKWYS